MALRFTRGADASLVLVVRLARRHVEFELLGAGHAREQRHVRLEVAFGDRDISRERLAVLNEVVGAYVVGRAVLAADVLAFLLAVFDADRGLDRAGSESLPHVTGEVRRQHLLLVAQVLLQEAESVGLGCRRDGPGAERIEWHAARRDRRIGEEVGRSQAAGALLGGVRADSTAVAAAKPSRVTRQTVLPLPSRTASVAIR